LPFQRRNSSGDVQDAFLFQSGGVAGRQQPEEPVMIWHRVTGGIGTGSRDIPAAWAPPENNPDKATRLRAK